MILYCLLLQMEVQRYDELQDGEVLAVVVVAEPISIFVYCCKQTRLFIVVCFYIFLLFFNEYILPCRCWITIFAASLSIEKSRMHPVGVSGFSSDVFSFFAKKILNTNTKIK